MRQLGQSCTCVVAHLVGRQLSCGVQGVCCGVLWGATAPRLGYMCVAAHLAGSCAPEGASTSNRHFRSMQVRLVAISCCHL